MIDSAVYYLSFFDLGTVEALNHVSAILIALMSVEYVKMLDKLK